MMEDLNIVEGAQEGRKSPAYNGEILSCAR